MLDVRSPHLASAFRREVRDVDFRAASEEVIDEARIASLPPSARRYLRFMGGVGRERDASLRASFSAYFRRQPGAWTACEAVQYDTCAPITRVFMMQLSLKKLPVTVRDNYRHGHGRMLARAFDLLTVAEGHGYELDVGELVTFLNDAVLMAPTFLLRDETTWSEVDANTFEVTLRDGAVCVTARVQVDARGAPLVFSTRDRFFDAPNGRRVRTEWRTPVAGWQDVGGRMLPTRAQAVWMLPEGPFAYADFRFDASRISFNVPPL